MKCKRCGYQNYDEAYSCRNCGAKMNKSKKRQIQSEKNKNVANMVSEALDNISYNNTSVDTSFYNNGSNFQNNSIYNEFEDKSDQQNNNAAVVKDNFSYNQNQFQVYNNVAGPEVSTFTQGVKLKFVIIVLLLIFILLAVGVIGLIVALHNKEVDNRASKQNFNSEYSNSENSVNKYGSDVYDSNNEYSDNSGFTVVPEKTEYTIKSAGTPAVSVVFKIPKHYQYCSNSTYLGEFYRTDNDKTYVDGTIGCYAGNAKEKAEDAEKYINEYFVFDNGDTVVGESCKTKNGSAMYIVCYQSISDTGVGYAEYSGYVCVENKKYVSINVTTRGINYKQEAYSTLNMIADSLVVKETKKSS